MAKATKHDWLIAGVQILTRYGAQELTVEALCSEMDLTKGSFYHHFRGIDDYFDRFLIYFEQEGTLQIIDRVNQEKTPQARIRKLIEIGTSYPPQLAVAMRAWAQQDDLVRRVFEKIDQQRLAYVTELWRPLVDSEEEAQTMADIFYSLLIGGEHMLPPLGQERHRAAYHFMFAAFLPGNGALIDRQEIERQENDDTNEQSQTENE
ncbi:MAG: TetR/AcrR family transcriptional regulator [Ardenticatenaceae bacterium]|nr:TetR/AcrR family transcriptional regulator [Ardenticatenaceae bacterium]